MGDLKKDTRIIIKINPQSAGGSAGIDIGIFMIKSRKIVSQQENYSTNIQL